MPCDSLPIEPAMTLAYRVRQRLELNCQIVHDSLHRRAGWTRSYSLVADQRAAGFGSIAVDGPWKDKPTIFEFYVLPDFRHRAFELFESFLRASGARYFEIQSNDAVLNVMLHTYGRDIASEKIVFADQVTTALPANGTEFHALTSPADILAAMQRRQGGGEWQLMLGSEMVAKGGILFHYNYPYGDIYMEVSERWRKQGFGSYLVQELKRVCYDLGAVPCARCNPTNLASRRTLQKAGFAPYAHILLGNIAPV